MGNYYYYPNTDSLTNGIKVVSLEHIEIIQYIYTGDEIMTINSLKNEGPLERYQFVYLLEEFPKMKILFNIRLVNFSP